MPCDKCHNSENALCCEWCDISVCTHCSEERLQEVGGSCKQITLCPGCLSHPSTVACDDMECIRCAVRDCPDHEPLHYHHDGCPACFAKENRLT